MRATHGEGAEVCFSQRGWKCGRPLRQSANVPLRSLCLDTEKRLGSGCGGGEEKVEGEDGGGGGGVRCFTAPVCPLLWAVTSAFPSPLPE